MPAPEQIYTVGHSTRTLEELVALLKDHGIQQVVDVRRFPTSRRMPWFAREHLETTLPRQGIQYHWLGDLLGGYRRGGYPRYMESEAFQEGLRRLEHLARQRPTALLCAERLWFRCHRRFIADALCHRGWQVIHLVDPGRRQPHPCTLNSPHSEKSIGRTPAGSP